MQEHILGHNRFAEPARQSRQILSRQSLGSYLALASITRSQFGQVLLAIRENETRASFAGGKVYVPAALLKSAPSDSGDDSR